MDKILDTVKKYLKTALIAAIAIGASLQPLLDFLQKMLDSL